ncbi:hypothetical protein GOBAR_DD17872 [Gossypium barbadense]|nr:hypothetical protein GOBAR_DD17872 [Gossypium barbadense]
MRVSIGSYNTPLSFVTPICSRPSGGGLISISSPSHSPPALRLSSFPGLRFCGGRKISVGARAGVNGASETTSFEPYLEEMDVVTFLDPPNYLIPLDPGGSIVAQFANQLCPLYFEVTQMKEVMSTEQPCDLAYEFGDGLFDLDEFPSGFPKPVKHPYPFSDEVVIYIRHMGPGVLVGQAWQEGKELDQVPQKLCGEILMVKEYNPLEN